MLVYPQRECLDDVWLLSMYELCVNRFVEKGNLEILLFSIQSQMRANNQKPYMPNEGRMISDINRAWEQLERAEHERELALRDELVRCSECFLSSCSLNLSSRDLIYKVSHCFLLKRLKFVNVIMLWPFRWVLLSVNIAKQACAFRPIVS